MPIALLTQDVIGKIAAGEVVERPAAAIKEMVENSMDAGASAITVEIRDGGIPYFRVTDNGCGIRQNEIRLAFERHATSKIVRAEDLTHIETMGFRGEALASVAAVSRVTCTTRSRGDESGVKVVNEGGVIRSIEEAACPEGTSFVVKDIFFNTPVRLKFLKKASYEASLVSDIMLRLILARPDISFRFINQGKTVYHSAGDGKIESAVYCIYGREMLTTMRRIDGHENGIVMKGYVGIGDSARGNRNHESFFINGRYLKSMLLSQALENACRERVMIGHYPACVLYLTMPFETVDVNVHPNKLEVRFQDETLVQEAVYDMVLDVLRQDTPLSRIPEFMDEAKPAPSATTVHVMSPEVSPIRPAKSEEAVISAPAAPSVSPLVPATPVPPVTPAVVPPPAAAIAPVKPTLANDGWGKPQQIAPGVASPAAFQAAAGDLHEGPGFAPAAPPPVYQPPVVEEQQFAQSAGADVKVLGVAFRTYIVAEYKTALLFIDQHAAHERLLFDRMMKLYDQHTASQALLVPQLVPLTAREMQVYHENEQALTEAGFESELFDDLSVQLRGVPVILGTPQLKQVFTDMLDALDGQKGLTTAEKRRSAILQQACKHAVKGGEALPRAVIEDLVRQMVDQGVTPTCPHGRPLVMALTQLDFEKRFKRIQ